jgi:hypothetical protein
MTTEDVSSDPDDEPMDQDAYDRAVGLYRGRVCRHPDPLRCVEDDQVLTQYGRELPGMPTFREKPAAGKPEVDFSLLKGRLSPEQAHDYVTSTGRGLERARVRYTTAGDLRAAGFTIVHTPGRIREGTHVSVILHNGDPLGAPHMPWTNAAAARFSACFNGSMKEA